MFLSQDDFVTVVRSTPLVSIDLIVENTQGEFLLGKRLNRPAQGYWFVPGGRVQKDEPLSAAFERLTEGELGLRLPLSAGEFYGVWQHFYNDNFANEAFRPITWCSVFVCEYRKKTCVCPTRSTKHTAGWRLRYCWVAKTFMKIVVPIFRMMPIMLLA